MLEEPRHDLHEIAGHMPIVQLGLEDPVPCVLAGPWRAGQYEYEGCVGNAAGRARLDRRGADLVVGNSVEDGGEAVHPLLEQRLECLRGDIAAGEAGASSCNHHVNVVVARPGLDLCTDLVDIVRSDG